MLILGWRVSCGGLGIDIGDVNIGGRVQCGGWGRGFGNRYESWVVLGQKLKMLIL